MKLKKTNMMKYLYALAFVMTISACKAQDANVKLSPDEFEKGMKTAGAQVLDVRTAKEFNSGHLPHSLWADWTDKNEFNRRIQSVDKDRPVYVYCLSGGRSSAAAAWMRANGFSKVLELQGGVNAWKGSGKQLEGQEPVKQMTVDEYWASIPKDQITLVDFGATWCPPCVKMEPVLEQLKNDKSVTFRFVKVDAGVHFDVMKSVGVEPLPTFIVYKNGKETWRKDGIVTLEELKAQLK